MIFHMYSRLVLVPLEEIRYHIFILKRKNKKHFLTVTVIVILSVGKMENFVGFLSLSMGTCVRRRKQKCVST